MKIALYVEDGLSQIVLTPETPTEKGVLEQLHDSRVKITLKKGEFYACQGGWTRHGQGEGSTIVVLTPQQGQAA